MYLGFVVEEVPCQDIHADALHPYTQSAAGCESGF